MYTSNFNLLKLTTNVLIFLVIFSIPIGYTEYRLRHNINNDYLSYKYKYDEMLKNKTRSDVVVMGTSHGAHGIIPDIVKIDGHSTYNFCFDGAAPSFNFELYNNIISICYTKPQLIIYDINSFMFDNKRFGRTFSSDYKFMPISVGFCNTRNNSAPIIMPYNYLRITHESDLYKALVGTFKNKKLDNLQIEHYNNGFVPNQKNFKVYDQPLSVINNPDEIAIFEKFIQLILSQNISLIFVETPDYTPEIKDTNVFKKNNALIDAFAKKYSIPFLNYNEGLKSNINNEKQYYSDQDHLNYLGARTFSRVLSSDINKLIISKKIGMANK